MPKVSLQRAGVGRGVAEPAGRSRAGSGSPSRSASRSCCVDAGRRRGGRRSAALRRGERQHRAEAGADRVLGDRAEVVGRRGRQPGDRLRVARRPLLPAPRSMPPRRRSARAEGVVAGARVGRAVAEPAGRRGAVRVGRCRSASPPVPVTPVAAVGRDHGRRSRPSVNDSTAPNDVPTAFVRDRAEVVGRPRRSGRRERLRVRDRRVARAERRAAGRRRARAERVVARAGLAVP